MKKFLAIIVLGSLWSGNVSANNLMGKQLKCGTTYGFMLDSVEYIKFVNTRDAHAYYINNTTLKVEGFPYTYKVLPTSIEIEWFEKKQYTISRKTLKTSEGKRCEIIKYNIRNRLEKKSKELLDKVSKDNKI